MKVDVVMNVFSIGEVAFVTAPYEMFNESGMAIKAAALGEQGVIIANITLFAVLIYELVGPMLTKIALTKAGDIKPEGKVSAREQSKLL